MARKGRREPLWLDRLVVDAIHCDQLREHGGLPGMRDENVLESALARARNRWHHERGADVATLAAAYGWALATSHPYRDGNKRVAFLALATFAALNGYELDAADEEIVQVMIAVADRRLGERALADWIRGRLVERRPK